MRHSHCRLVKLLGVSSLVLRARHNHLDKKQAQLKLERMVLLEHAMERPARRRAQTVGTLCTAETASYLRSIDDRVSAARDTAHRGTVTPNFSIPTEGASDVPSVVSLSHFLTECKQLRTDFGLEKRMRERERLRLRFRTFWETHAANAVVCCELHGRDFGFVAEHGLSDDRLHLPLSALRTGLLALASDSTVSTCRDAMGSLRYLCRELLWLERQRKTTCARSDTAHDEAHAVSPAALVAFRRDLTDVAVDRIVFFFVLHSPQWRLAPTKHATDAHAVSTVLGTAQDAINGLEALSCLHVDDMSVAAKQRVVDRIMTLPQSSSHYVEAHCETSLEVTLTQAYLVTQTFGFLITQRHGMNFTALVHAFSMLRVLLPVLWPPYRHADRTGRGPPTSPSPPSPPSVVVDGKAIQEATTGPKNYKPAASYPGTLRKEKDALLRITWALATTLQHRDSSFINPYHFLKISSTLARLPSFTLAPHASNKVEMRCLSGGVTAVPTTLGSTSAGWNQRSTVKMSPEDFWQLVVNKACLFMPSLPLPQRRIACRNIHICIAEKRGHLLGHNPRTVPSEGLSTTFPKDSGGVRISRLSGSAEDLLLPLVEEMASLTEGFDAAVRAGGGSGSGGRHRKRSGGNRRYQNSADSLQH